MLLAVIVSFRTTFPIILHIVVEYKQAKAKKHQLGMASCCSLLFISDEAGNMESYEDGILDLGVGHPKQS
jgi:hypothetical protein